jgi:hypothetical protein
MSIPDWSYAQGYYDELLQAEGVYIRTDPVKGKGLFTRAAIAQGALALQEEALCCAQNVDEARLLLPVCAKCLVSLETPAEIVARHTGVPVAKAAAAMPQHATFARRPTRVPCEHAGKGCATLFCSETCRDAAWRTHHYAACAGGMTSGERAALAEFMAGEWTVGGIDLSDTHVLALTFMATVATRMRLHGLPAETAYSPTAQLIRSPISKFAFTYLLVAEYEEEMKKEAATDAERAAWAARTPAQRWAHFARYRDSAEEDPIAAHASVGCGDKAAVIAKSWALMVAALRISDKDRAYFTVERWSELLGAVLLNGQERSPNSSYTEYMSHVKKLDQAALKSYHRGLRAQGHNPSGFDTSTRGQGIYTIGACFNHSCAPNVQVSYAAANDETLVVHALRDIEPEEELFISYIDEDAPFPERQQQLYEHYLFTCLCTKCTADAEARVSSE